MRALWLVILVGVIPTTFALERQTMSLTPYWDQKAKAFGYKNQKGEHVVPPRFPGAYPFSEGRAVVIVNGTGARAKEELYGYIDESGHVVVEPQFLGAGPFSDGLAVVKVADREHAGEYRVGFIDKQGKFVIAPRFHAAEAFSGGRALVNLRSGVAPHFKYSSAYIDKSGKVVTPLESDPAQLDDRPFIPYFDQKAGAFAYMNYRRDPVIPARFSDAKEFSEGLAAASVRETDPHNPKDLEAHLYGYIDITGKFVIPPKYPDASPFFEGKAAVAFPGTGADAGGVLLGYIDKTGATVIPPQFVGAGRFSEGRARVNVLTWHKDDLGKKYLKPSSGFIDASGKFMLPAKFDEASDFSDGVAVVGEGGHYHLNVLQKIRFPFLLAVSAFSGQVSGPAPGKDVDSKWGHIDLNGKFIVEPKFDEAYRFFKGVALVSLKTKKGFLLKNGKYLVEPKFEDATGFDFSDPAPIKDKGKWGYINTDGKIVIRPQFESAGRFDPETGLAKVTLSGRSFSIDRTGRTIK